MDNLSTSQYEQEQQLDVRLDGEVVHIKTKPGVVDWNTIYPSTELLAKHISIRPSDRVFQFGCYHGGLSVNLARHLSAGQLTVTDIDFLNLEMTRKTLAVNNIHSVKLLSEVEIPQDEYGTADTALLHLPKGRALARRWLVQAYHLIKPVGSLYLAGSNKSGIQSAIKDATEIFGNLQLLGYKKGNRIAHLFKNAKPNDLPGWVNSPGIASGTWVEYPVTLRGRKFLIRSLPGVFSYDHLDAGTEMLLSLVDIPAGKRVLDVGCGCGVIGLFAATHGAAWIDLIDNNIYAVASSKENLINHHCTNTAVYAGDLLNPVMNQRYDLILSNPPFHVGLGVDYQVAQAMINQSFRALTSPGQLVIVANRFIPYEQLIKEKFSNVSTLGESGKFRVLSGLK